VSTTQESSDCSTEQETIDQAMQALADAGVEGETLDARIAALVSERDQLQSDFDSAQGDKQAWQVRANDAAERINEACVMMYADAHAQYEFGQDKVEDVNDAYEKGAYHRVVMHALDVARHFWTAGILAATVTRYQGQTPGLEVDIELTECTENAQAWYRWGREYARAGHGNVAAAASELIEPGGRPDIPDIESTIEETAWASPNELTFEYDVTSV